VHAVLLTNTRAKIEALIEWAWDYFGRVRRNPILDRVEQTNINWNGDDDAARASVELQSLAQKVS
jgi:NADH:quinone reductase (non-electrogenic)